MFPAVLFATGGSRMWKRLFHPFIHLVAKMLFGGEAVCLPLLTRPIVVQRSTCRLPGAFAEMTAFKCHKLNEPLKCRQEFTQRWVSASWLMHGRATARTEVGFWLVSWKVVWWRFSQSWFDSSVCIVTLWSRTALDTPPTRKDAGLLNIMKQ